MAKRIVIDPVTRIEGHAKISIFMDDAGNVADAEFHVVEFRGFEKFCEGRPYPEMPGITQRMLTKQLRALEEDGLITRKVYAEVPPRVEYALSPTGERLRPVIDILRSWGLEHKARLEAEAAANPTKKPKIAPNRAA